MNQTLREKLLRIEPLRRCARLLWGLARKLPRDIPIYRVPSVRRWSGRPIGYYNTVAEYLTQYPGRGWLRCVRPAGKYERVPVQSLVGNLPIRFTPPQTVVWDQETAIWLEGCRYWGEYGGSIVSHDDRLLWDLSPDVWGLEKHALFNVMKLPTPIKLRGLTAIVSTGEANTNYSHWMLDLLPRLLLLQQAGFGPDVVDRYLVNMGSAPYCLETMKAVGIDERKIVPVDRRSHFVCETAVTTSIRDKHWQHSLPQWVAEELRRLFCSGSEVHPAKRRLYLSRRDCAFRRLLNEGELLPCLAAAGFEVLEPHRYCVQDQAKMFADAECIISLHGSALTNVAFCRPGTRIIELYPRDYFDVSFWTMATVSGCEYHAGICEAPEREYLKNVVRARRQDCLITQQLLSALEHAAITVNQG